MGKASNGIYMLPDDVLAEMSMTQEYNRMWLLVEGKRDVIFFKSMQHPKIDNAKIIALDGWENVVSVASKHKLGGKLQVLGIVDSDYRGVGYSYPPNIIYSDMHSLESMMFWSDDFQPVMSNAIPTQYFAKGKSIKEFLDSIRKSVLECCLPLSKYRMYCYINKINTSFKDLDHKKIVDSAMRFDTDKTVRYLSSKEGNAKLVRKEDVIQSQTFKICDKHFENECNFYHGHDLIGFCAMIIKNKHNSHKEKEDLEILFSAVFAASGFKSTPMYMRIHSMLKFFHSQGVA